MKNLEGRGCFKVFGCDVYFSVQHEKYCICIPHKLYPSVKCADEANRYALDLAFNVADYLYNEGLLELTEEYVVDFMDSIKMSSLFLAHPPKK